MCVCVYEHASKQMCDRITCMKEYNAAALFNLCFSWRQMFEFVRTHGKICNNKTIFSFCFDNVPPTAFSLFSPVLILSPSPPRFSSFCCSVSPFLPPPPPPLLFHTNCLLYFLPFQHFTALVVLPFLLFVSFASETKLHETVAL